MRRACEIGMPTTAEDDTKKELRTTLTTTECFFVALMILSPAVSWAAVIGLRGDPAARRHALGHLAVFQALWAVRNFVSVSKRERGMFTYAIVAAGCYLDNAMFAVGGSALVLGSYLFVASFIAKWPAG